MNEKEECTLYEVPLAEAQECIREYRNMMQNHLGMAPPKIIRAYTVHARELLEVLGITNAHPKFDKIRVYLGKKSGDDAHDMKLFLTPVRDGRDVILKAGNSSNENPLDGGIVFDFNLPCPSSCDPQSPLFKV